jgi:hypothetical protein
MRSAFLSAARTSPCVAATAPGVSPVLPARLESLDSTGQMVVTNKTNGHRHSKSPTASTTVASAEEYKVGPGHPPKAHQFKPGQSGNPKGRKRKPPSLALDLKRLVEEALAEKVTVKQGDKERILTMAEAGIKQLMTQFAKGDHHARRDVFFLAEKFGIDVMPRQAVEEALDADQQAILDTYVARQMGARAIAASSPALAPPDLLDDDEQPE